MLNSSYEGNTYTGQLEVLDDGQIAASTVELEGGGEAEQGNGKEQNSLHVWLMSRKQLNGPWPVGLIYRWAPVSSHK